MRTAPTTTAPDFQDLGKDVPRLAATAGDTLELLTLAAGPGRCAGVDLASGVLVRAWFDGVTSRLRPFDVALVTLAADTGNVADPTEPESVLLAGAPSTVGRITGRRAERLLRPLLHPSDTPLLGSHGPAVPFWERRPDHPSIALVESDGPVLLLREPAYLACRFSWDGAVRELPCLDRRLAGEMDRAGQVRRVADKRSRLVVALNPPIDGHCPKVVEAVLPRA